MTERRPGRDFMDGLRELDRHYQSIDLPPGSVDRLQRRIREPKPRAWLAAGLATAAVAAVVFFVLVYATGAERASGFSIVRKSEGFRLGEGKPEILVVAQGEGVLEVEEIAVRLDVEMGSSVKREERSVRIVRGRVRVRVEPRPERKQPVEIRVSHGAIEVLGTSFTVVQEEDSGQVTLHSGKIRFVALSGEVMHLLPSESLRWPLPAPVSESDAGAPPAPPQPEVVSPPRKVSKTKPAKPAPESGRFETGIFMTQLERLRVRRRFAELADLIRRDLPRIEDRELKESLSYELGDILVHRLGQHQQACNHWRRHLAQFPGGRYSEAIRKSRMLLQCEPGP